MPAVTETVSAEAVSIVRSVRRTIEELANTQPEVLIRTFSLSDDMIQFMTAANVVERQAPKKTMVDFTPEIGAYRVYQNRLKKVHAQRRRWTTADASPATKLQELARMITAQRQNFSRTR